MKNTLCLLVLFLGVTSSMQARVVEVSVDSPQEAIARLEDGDTLRFQRGARYDFWSDKALERDYYESNTTDQLPKRLAVLLHGLNNITVQGNGSMWVMHGVIQPLTIDSCTGIKVESLRVDWDIPMTAQAKVIDVTNRGCVLQIDTLESPYRVENNRLVFHGENWSSPIFSMMEFRPYDANGIAVIQPGTGDVYSWYFGDTPVVDLGAGRVFMRVTSLNAMPQLGNYVVLRHNERTHAGVFVQNSKDISFDNVWIHNTAGLGILCQYTENLTFCKSGVVPNWDKKRYLSGHDDGFHLMGCRGKIRVEECRWQGLMDDPVNIHGTSVRIVAIEGKNKLLCRFMQHQSVGMEWGQLGNKVGFLESESLKSLGRSTIKGYRKISVTDFEVELASLPAKLKVGDALENLHWVPTEVIVRNNLFGGCRARGLLVTVPAKVRIEGNTFYSSGAAILISGDAAQWYETGAVKDVLITNNIFESICNTSYYQFGMGVISIDPEIHTPDSHYPFHTNIRIIDNTFKSADNPLVYAKSVDGLVIKGNKVIRTTEYAPRLAGSKKVETLHCKNVVIGKGGL